VNLTRLRDRFVAAGCKKLYAKALAENDNSKQQVYFAKSAEALNILPSKQILANNTESGPSFKALLDFGWLLESGQIEPAPRAQLILYAQYPEVRFSGFLVGCKHAPSELMDVQNKGRPFFVGRVLFLGVTDDRKVVGFLAAGDSPLALEFRSGQFPSMFGVFAELPLPNILDEPAARAALLRELARIHQLGWIDSKQLGSGGKILPCNAPQCGGFTLEAELGVSKNSESKPDFLGWEVKQYNVSSFERPDSGKPITLITPEPTGGFYRDHGTEAFIRKFGYADKRGRSDRLNFGGKHIIGSRQALTRLTMSLRGYDLEREKVIDADGAIELRSDTGELAAEWAFDGLFAHWSRKHMLAAYVPSKCRKEPVRQYSYGPKVRLAQRTDPLRLLRALADGTVFYDPGIKLENASTKPKVKPRSQFRIASKEIAALYETVQIVEV
jgi:hypothetical protein